MAATTSNVTPRRNGFDFAALSASSGRQDSGEELARLRAALETLSDLVIAHGVMDARTLESIVGDLIRPPMVPVSLSAPLPPPAQSATDAAARASAPRATAPVAARQPIAAAAAAAVAARPAAATPTAAPQAAVPKPAVAAPMPAVAAVAVPQPAAAAPIAAAPLAARPTPVAAPQPAAAAVAAPKLTPVTTPVAAVTPGSFASLGPVVVAPMPAPVEATPFVATPAAAATPKRNPFEAARIEAELGNELPPPNAPQGFLGRLFGKKKTSAAAVAANAASVEFTERMPKLPVDGLYAEQQRATELSFPPPSTARKPRAAAPAAKPARTERPANHAPARFCDRCWRRVDSDGSCKSCSATG